MMKSLNKDDIYPVLLTPEEDRGFYAYCAKARLHVYAPTKKEVISILRHELEIITGVDKPLFYFVAKEI